MPQVHPLDQVADDLAQWIDDMATALAGALTDGNVAPFSAQADASERLAYYHQAFFNGDGTPNEPGRIHELQRLGPEGYAQAMRAVLDRHQEVRTTARTLDFRPAHLGGKG